MKDIRGENREELTNKCMKKTTKKIVPTKEEPAQLAGPTDEEIELEALKAAFRLLAAKGINDLGTLGRIIEKIEKESH